MNAFEEHYLSTGFESQRKYPNEGLLAFLGGNYSTIPYGERSRLKVLELGCGSGANLWAVSKEGFDAYGIDIAPTGLELCRKMLEKWSASATVRLGDMTALPFEAGFFDVIFDVVSMQHLNMEQHFKSYSEVHRCLKKGGRFFSYHLGENSISLKSTSDMVDHCTVANIGDGYPLANNGQTCFISANEVRRLLRDTGFKGVNIEKVSRSYGNQRQYIEYLSISAEA